MQPQRLIDNTITVTGHPPWLSSALFDQIGAADNISYSFKLTRAERRTYRKKTLVPPSGWAEKHRVITDGPLKGRLMDLSITPHLKGFMDASFFPSVRYIVNCKSVQICGSTGIHTCLAYAMDRKPGPALLALPDKDRATKTMRDRIQQMIMESPALKKLLTGVDDDMTTLRINLVSMLMYVGWSGSATSLGDFPCMYVVKEEADKWEKTPNKEEARSHDLIDKRVTTFQYDSKIWDNSTPTTVKGHIWTALTTETQIISDFWVCCPDCGRHQVMVFSQIEWPGGSKANRVEVKARKLAYYICRFCGSTWDDHRRNLAARAGHWRSLPTSEWLECHTALTEKGELDAMDGAKEMFQVLETMRPENIGFFMPAWFSYFVSLSKSAAAFLKYQQTGQLDDLKDFRNNYAAVPWFEYHQDREENVILELRDDRPRGLVPGGGRVAGLLAQIDTQDDGFIYEIRAWGYGLAGDSWQVREGFVDTEEGLIGLLFEKEGKPVFYKDVDGKKYHVQAAVIDAMGHRTREVYDLCKKFPRRLVPLQGVDKLATPWAWTNIEFYPGTKKPIPGGIALLRVNTTYYKDALAAKLKIAFGDPGCWYMHSTTTENWARQMCVEFINEKGKWECPEGKANHAWDVSVYGLALYDLLEIAQIQDQDEQPEGSATKPKTVKKEKKTRW